MSKTYRELLLDPRWQRRRLEMLQAAGWQCSACGNGRATLHVHHRKYIPGRMPWQYCNSDLQVLCEPCHSAEHDKPAAPVLPAPRRPAPAHILERARLEGEISVIVTSGRFDPESLATLGRLSATIRELRAGAGS